MRKENVVWERDYSKRLVAIFTFYSFLPQKLFRQKTVLEQQLKLKNKKSFRAFVRPGVILWIEELDLSASQWCFNHLSPVSLEPACCSVDSHVALTSC